MSFSTPSAGSFTFLAETSASNVATVDLNGYFTSSYDYYQIFFDDHYQTTNGATLNMQFSTTGSYTVQTSSYYSCVFYAVNTSTGASANQFGFWNSNYMGVTPSLSNTSTQVSNTVLTIFNPMGSNVKTFTSVYNAVYANISEQASGTSSGRWNSTTAITGIRFLTNTGNIYARKIRIYGIKNS